MKLHGSPISTATRRALACLYEKELHFEFVVVDMKTGQHKTEAYLALNPFGQVPAFEDGDLKLFESRAINMYVAHEYASSGTPLILLSKEMAIVTLWLQVEAHQFNQLAGKLCWESFYKPMFGMTTDDAVVAEHEGKIAKVLDVYEARLAQSKYLAGDCFTLADLHHLPEIYCLMQTSVKKVFESRPHLHAWVTEILARPAWQKVLAHQKH